MFNLEVFPYLLFFMMVIPPFVFGFFKGWKASLVSLFTLFVLSGIIVGISIKIYDDALWPSFKGWFVNKEVSGGLNADVLKDVAKPSVISLTVGMAVYPMLLISWLIYLIIKKPLNKYMRPRINKISSNESEMFVKKTLKSKLIGSSILGTVGILIAGTTTSAVATITVPTRKTNSFSNMNSFFSKAFTYGQGYYDSDYQAVYEFLPITKNDPKAMSSLKSLFDVSGFKDQTSVTWRTSIEYLNQDNIINEFANVFNRKRSAIAILLLAINGRGGTFDLTDFDGGGQEQHPHDTINNFQTALFNTPVNLKVSSDVLESLLSEYEKTHILPFEQTAAYQNLVTAEQLKAKLDNDLANLNQELSELQTHLETDIQKMKNLESERVDNDARNRIATSKIPGLERIRNDKQQIRDTKQSIYSLELTENNRLKDALKDANNQMQILKGQLQVINRHINDYQSGIRTETSNNIQRNSNIQHWTNENITKTNEVSRKQSNVNSITRRLSVLRSELHILQNQKNSKNRELSSISSQLSSKDGKIQRINQDLQTLKNNLNNAQTDRERQRIQNSINAKNGELSQAKNDQSTLQQREARVNNDISDLVSRISQKSQTIYDNENQKSQLLSDISNDQATITQNEQSIQNARNWIATSERNIRSYKTQLTNARNDKTNKQAEIRQWKRNEIDPAQNDLDNETPTFQRKESQYEFAESQFNNAQSNLDEQVRIKNNTGNRLKELGSGSLDIDESQWVAGEIYDNLSELKDLRDHLIPDKQTNIAAKKVEINKQIEVVNQQDQIKQEQKRIFESNKEFLFRVYRENFVK